MNRRAVDIGFPATTTASPGCIAEALAMIKDILVHVDGSSGDELRVQHAEILAALVQAHLTGLFTNQLAEFGAVMPSGGHTAAEVLAELDREVRSHGDLVHRRLSERFSRLLVPNELRRLDDTMGGLEQRAVAEARSADLFITSRPYHANGAGRWSGLFEVVLFGGGRSIYLVPPDRRPPDTIRRVLVAWRDTREAARALAEAAPLIATATRTGVVLVDPPAGSTDSMIATGTDVARHVSRLGSNVEVSVLQSGDRPVSEIILDQARRMPADLIVMGAYGHSRGREWVLGGATLDMLGSCDFPLLVAH
jgi:nucleotide-binding universal stress UspA family protein